MNNPGAVKKHRGGIERESWLDQKFEVYLDPQYYEKILPRYKFDNKSDKELLDERLKKWVKTRNSKFKLALELGCGTGRGTAILEKYCERIIACDLSPRMLEIAKSRLGWTDRVRFVHDELFEFIKKNQDLVLQSDLVVSLWALHYSLNAEFAERSPSQFIFNAKNPDAAAARCMEKLTRLFDGLPANGRFVFFHYDPESKEQEIAHDCWTKIVPFPFGKQTASLYVLKKFFEKRADLHSSIERIRGVSPLHTLDQALEIYMNFHFHTLFNHSPLKKEVMRTLTERLKKYKKTDFNIPAGTLILSGEKIVANEDLVV